MPSLKSFLCAGGRVSHSLTSPPKSKEACLWDNNVLVRHTKHAVFYTAVDFVRTGVCQIKIRVSRHQLVSRTRSHTVAVCVRSAQQSHNSCVANQIQIFLSVSTRLPDALAFYQWQKEHEAQLAIVADTFGQWVVLYRHLLRGCLIPCLTSPWWTAGAPQASGHCLLEMCQMSTSCLAGSSEHGISDKHTDIKRTIQSALLTKVQKNVPLTFGKQQKTLQLAV